MDFKSIEIDELLKIKQISEKNILAICLIHFREDIKNFITTQIFPTNLYFD